MLRNLNATNRKTISPQHYSLKLEKVAETSPPHFNLTLELESYKFSKSARICVEAWRGSISQRWNFGTVGGIEQGDKRFRKLKELSVSATFQIKVISTETPGLILGQTKSVIRSCQPADNQSFLPIQYEDFHEIWRLEHSNATDQPVLQLNTKLRDVEEQIGNPTSLLCLTVLPAVLRAVLVRFLLIENFKFDETEQEQVAYQWFDFSYKLVPYDSLLTDLQENDDDEEKRVLLSEWIESVVDKFAQNVLKVNQHIPQSSQRLT